MKCDDVFRCLSCSLAVLFYVLIIGGGGGEIWQIEWMCTRMKLPNQLIALDNTFPFRKWLTDFRSMHASALMHSARNRVNISLYKMRAHDMWLSYWMVASNFSTNENALQFERMKRPNETVRSNRNSIRTTTCVDEWMRECTYAYFISIQPGDWLCRYKNR